MALGEQLRKARISKALTASQVAEATRMKVQIVEAIEREDFKAMAAPIYGKGFIKLYAEYMGLDPAPMLTEFSARFMRMKTPSLRTEDRSVRRSAPGSEDELALFDDEPAASPPTPAAPSAAPAAPVAAPSPMVAPPPAAAPRPVERKPSPLSAWREAAAPAPRAAPVSDSAVDEDDEALGEPDEPSVAEEGDRNPASPGFRISDLRFMDSPLKTAAVIVGALIVLMFIVSSLSRCVRTDETGRPVVVGGRDTFHRAVEPPLPYAK